MNESMDSSPTQQISNGPTKLYEAALSVEGTLRARTKPSGDCLLWTGTLDHYGYGVLNIKRKLYKVHRLVYILEHPEFDQSLFVCHTCDIRNCVEIQHLFTGTNKDNMDDKIKKGRTWYPTSREQLGMSKFSDNDVEDIKGFIALGWPQVKIAEWYGVESSTISRILSGGRRKVKE